MVLQTITILGSARIISISRSNMLIIVCLLSFFTAVSTLNHQYCPVKPGVLPNPHHFLHSPHHHLLFCWSHKTGSTSVSHVFSLINNISFILETGQYYRLPEALAPRSQRELSLAINNSFVFTIVRHPLLRLVSAYR